MTTTLDNTSQKNDLFDTLTREKLLPVVHPDNDGESASRHSLRLAYCSTAEARNLVPYHTAFKLYALPLALHSLKEVPFLSVAIPSPFNLEALKELRFACGMEIVPEAVEKDIVRKAIHAAYLGSSGTLEKAIFQANTSTQQIETISASFHPHESDEPIPELLKTILERAICLSASDIHIEAQDGNSRIRFRVDGLLQLDNTLQLYPHTAQALCRRIKILCKLDTSRTDTAQDGSFSFHSSEQTLRLRVSTLPQIAGEKIVLRLLANSFVDVLHRGTDDIFLSLGLKQQMTQLLKAHLGADNGAILLSGPTGSGKSTLLYAALDHLNCLWRNIITLEDPVERIIPGINQTEVKEASGLGFAELLPRILRQDPDVVMIGEIRDTETAATAMNAAVTGCIVLSTVHAGDSLEVFARLMELGVHAKLVSSALRLIVSQRLVPKNCRNCLSEETEPSQPIRNIFCFPKEVPIRFSSGCAKCRFSGISGRLGVFEFLPMNDSLRKALLGGATHWELRQKASEDGFRPLLFDIREALMEGLISPDSALRAIGISPDLLA